MTQTSENQDSPLMKNQIETSTTTLALTTFLSALLLNVLRVTIKKKNNCYIPQQPQGGANV